MLFEEALAVARLRLKRPAASTRDAKGFQPCFKKDLFQPCLNPVSNLFLGFVSSLFQESLVSTLSQTILILFRGRPASTLSQEGG
jgi:hypothetical protein